MRAFVAVELPEAFRGEVVELARELSRSCAGRFVPWESLHLTLAFLGEVGEAEASRAVDALEGSCAGRAAVPLVPDGLGSFGRPRDATLWLGLRKEEGLMALAGAVREGLAARGLAFDEKPFLPHVTLARHARLPKGALPRLPFPNAAEATRVTLFRSILEPEHARYKPLHTVELG